jgi:uncharacterized integral membrane protein (TIGR00698 family)
VGCAVGLDLQPHPEGAQAFDFAKSGFRTELFLKIGLVLLGAGISFKVIVTAAAGAILQGVIMVASVYFFSWWLGGKFGLSDSLRAVMSTAVSICGVSAAIAAAGSVLAKKEEITYVTALVIITALPLMIIAPLIAEAMNMPEPIAGAWFGGNVDTTAAVVGAGTIYGETAQQIASIVKQTQNALIGVVAFLLALYFTTVVEGKKEKPSPMIIWQRFPKFVLGFIVTSLIFTFGFIDKDVAGKAIAGMKDWAFCLAFVCMGLELSVSGMKKMGWAPFVVYLIVTVFNTVLALGVCLADLRLVVPREPVTTTFFIIDRLKILEGKATRKTPLSPLHRAQITVTWR